MFWVCLISRRDTSPWAKTRRDPRSATLATDRTVIKNWRPNRLNLRLLTLPQTLKEASSCPLGTATSLSHRGIFSHRLNVKLNSSVSFFNVFVLWQKLSDCQLPHVFFFFFSNTCWRQGFILTVIFHVMTFFLWRDVKWFECDDCAFCWRELEGQVSSFWLYSCVFMTDSRACVSVLLYSARPLNAWRKKENVLMLAMFV